MMEVLSVVIVGLCFGIAGGMLGYGHGLSRGTAEGRMRGVYDATMVVTKWLEETQARRGGELQQSLLRMMFGGGLPENITKEIAEVYQTQKEKTDV
jgi:hypothetical protein